MSFQDAIDAYIKQQILADEFEKRLVWNKGTKILGLDPNTWRTDSAGRLMKYEHYGKNRSFPYEWEKDHILRESDGGSDELENLRPLHWKTNMEREQEW